MRERARNSTSGINDQAAACAFRANRLGGKVQRSITQAPAIAFAANCGFEDAFGQRGLPHPGLQLRRKRKRHEEFLPQKDDGLRIKTQQLRRSLISSRAVSRLARDLLVNVTTVRQSDGHCLTFCFQRFEFTANASRSIE